MDVWDPGEEKTVLSQIKKLISRLYRGLETSRYLLYPGIFTHFSVFALWTSDRVHSIKLAMAKGGSGGEIKPTCHSTFRTEHDCVHKTGTGV